jgi:hypothetical protein
MTANAVTRYNNYFERYNDEGLDPFGGDYLSVMASFRASVGRENNSVARRLYDQVFNTADVQPHLYLMLTQQATGEATISVLHRPYRHVFPMGTGTASMDLAFMGDMSGLLPPTVVYFPEEGFAYSGNIIVPKPGILDEAFNQDASLQFVGPYDDDSEPGTEVIATRTIMYCPPTYAPIALANPNMTPRKAWEAIGGSIRTGDNADLEVIAMQPLLDWLRAACTSASVGVEHPIVSEAPSYVHPPVTALDRAIETRLLADLPGILPSTGPHTDTTAAINHMTSEMLRVNHDRQTREQSAKAKTPESYFGAGVTILCRVTYSTTVQQLPEVYFDIAKSPKRMERLAIEERLRAVADTLSLLDYVPAATATLSKKISGCDFAHIDVDDLEAGIHPFCTTYRSPNSHTKLKQALAVYDDLREGTGASVLDFHLLRETEKVGVPYTMSEVTYCFKSFRVLAHTILGPHHPMTQQWDNFVQMWVAREARLSENLEIHQFVLVLRWLQLRMSAWFTDQHRDPVHVNVPEFTKLITKIVYGEAWEPKLPPKYQSITPARGGGPPTNSGTPATAPRRTPAATAPAPAPAAAQGPAQAARGARVPNNAADAAFSPFRLLGLALATVRDKAKEASKPVPQNDSNTDFCLSYHVLGFCWENCGRKEDHRAHQATERTKLLNWCTECYREGGPL